MTIWDLFALWRRQWVVSLLCLLLPVLGLVHSRDSPPVYWASTSVILIPPYLKGHLAPLGGNAIPLAGIVEKLLNADTDAPPAVSPDVSIIDRGIYDGVVADVPNYGGQWAENYTNPMIVVQVSAAHPETVTRRIKDVTTRINVILTELQDETAVPMKMRAQSLALPPKPAVLKANGARSRALVASVALSTLALIIVPFGADWLSGTARRRRRRSPSG